MKNHKVLAICFLVIALIISHIMCVHVAFAYCNLLWGIKYAGFSAPAYVAFFLLIPYLVGIVVTLIIALIFWKKAKVFATTNP